MFLVALYQRPLHLFSEHQRTKPYRNGKARDSIFPFSEVSNYQRIPTPIQATSSSSWSLQEWHGSFVHKAFLGISANFCSVVQRWPKDAKSMLCGLYTDCIDLYSIGVFVDIILPHVKLPSLRFCRANDMRSMPDSITGQANPIRFT